MPDHVERIPTSASSLRLAVIVGSVRAGRFGPTVANWFHAQAGDHPDLAVDIIDLAETAFPCPEFASRIGTADAIVVVTPEYNHSYPGELKIAIDSVRSEWRAKPIGFVSYGGISGGLRAVEQLRLVFAELHAVTVRETVSFHQAHRRFDQAGEPTEPGAAVAARALLDQLTWWAHALREARAVRPYG